MCKELEKKLEVFKKICLCILLPDDMSLHFSSRDATKTTCTPTTPTPELNRRDEKESEAESMTSNRTPDGDKF